MSNEILEKLKKAILDYDSERAVEWAKKAIEEKIDPIAAVDAITESIKHVGDLYGKGELWLPDLIGAATTMKSALEILEKEILNKGSNRESLGKVVIGTVHGDIHSIGENMVATLLLAEGFDVHDLGVDIPAQKFVDAVKQYKPDILALSALMTTTAHEMKKVIDLLNKENLRSKVKLMIGGAPITDEFAKSIGADGYNATAPGGAKLARKLLGK
ncbi:MAG: cobalamin B12-binding domain-containing protein [Candidatus Humimicrobiaceae bacterium]